MGRAGILHPGLPVGPATVAAPMGYRYEPWTNSTESFPRGPEEHNRSDAGRGWCSAVPERSFL